MPELPEVEVNRRALEELVQGLTIDAVEIFYGPIFVNSMHAQLNGRTIQAIHRRGKYLLFDLGDLTLVSHLRMEGKYFYYTALDVPEILGKHTHVVIIFQDGSQLHYNDVRKFGRIEVVDSSSLDVYFQTRKLGPEPTIEAFRFDAFKAGLNARRTAVKVVLLSQQLVVGLGNIYVDEALFQAKIHPLRPANQLNDHEIIRLHQAIIDVLQRATELGGSTIRTYTNTFGKTGSYQDELKVYGKSNQPCPNCHTPIIKIKVGGRGTHLCPQCQVM